LSVKKYPKYPFTILLLLLFWLSAFIYAGAEASLQDILFLELKGTVTAGKSSFLERQLKELDPRQFQAVLIEMDTPGGLLDSTLNMSRAFSSAEVPVIVLVAPSGAIAASAGAFLLVSADIAAMAPGTTVGAAMPVALTPGGAEPAEEKTVNFLAGHIRSIAREKGRPPEVAEKFVTENLTLDAREAKEAGIIDLLAASPQALLDELDGWEVTKGGRTFVLSTRGADLIKKEMNLQERVQDRISDPQIAFLLLMAGALGLYFGFSMPGTFIPEVLGGIALILGIYGLGLFDTNTAGIVLIILGVILLVTEIFTAGFGILGIGGGISLLIGAILLPREPLMAEGWYTSFIATAAGVALAVSGLSFLIITVLIRSRRLWREAGDFFRPAQEGIAVEELNPRGTVKTRGELWKAVSEDGRKIEVGTPVEILNQKGLTLVVRAKKEHNG